MFVLLPKEPWYEIFQMLDGKDCVSLAGASPRFLSMLRDFWPPRANASKVKELQTTYPLLCELIQTQYSPEPRIWAPCLVKFLYAASHGKHIVFYTCPGSLLHRVLPFLSCGKQEYLRCPFEVAVSKRPFCFAEQWSSLSNYTLYVYTDRDDSISAFNLTRELEAISADLPLNDRLLPYLFSRPPDTPP